MNITNDQLFTGMILVLLLFIHWAKAAIYVIEVFDNGGVKVAICYLQRWCWAINSHSLLRMVFCSIKREISVGSEESMCFSFTFKFLRPHILNTWWWTALH